MRYLSEIEKSSVVGGANNCACITTSILYKWNKADGPECMVACCANFVANNRWVWFGTAYSTSAQCGGALLRSSNATEITKE